MGLVTMRKKLTIENMQAIARERRGECLSKTYIDSSTKLKWRCEKRHTWWAVPESIKQGTWCNVCGGSQQLTIEEMQAIARERRGECLSKTYINSHTKLKWRCEKGHKWEAIPASIKNKKSWCRKCSREGRKPQISEMQAIARERRGECLSKTYIDSRTKLKWRCEKRHTWWALPRVVKGSKGRQGTWCPDCQKNTIEEMQAIARERRGECLSKTYIDSSTAI